MESFASEIFFHTNLQSQACQVGKEEEAQAYSGYVEASDDEATAGRRMNAAWYKTYCTLPPESLCRNCAPFMKAYSIGERESTLNPMG
jgi:hypothetical protein